MGRKSYRVLGLITLGILLGLVALACAPAEEPTATPAPEVATPTSAPAVAEPTATSMVAAAEQVAARARPVITAEIIESLSQMTLKEILAAFPATFPVDYAYEDIKRGGTFRGAITFDIATWDTRKAAAGGTTSVGNMVYERFVQYEQGPGRNPTTPAIVPDMAESWKFNEDGTKLTLKLRQGMYWGDMDDPFQKGPEIVAEDFLFNIIEYRDNSVQGGNYRTVESVEAPDRYTLVMNFTGPSFFVLPFLAGKDGLQFNPHLARAGRLDREIVGPGPFIVTEQKKSIEVRVARNPNHFWKDERGNPLPYLDEVQLLIVPDATTRLALLRTRRVEYAASVARLPRDLKALLRTNPDLQVFAGPGSGIHQTVAFQLKNPLWQDVNARRALTLVTDGKAISDVVYTGLAMPMDKYEWWYWTDTMPTWEDDLDALYGPYQNHTDVAKARELWAQTGLGELTLDLPYYAYSVQYTDTMAILVDDWSKLGVTLRPKSSDYSDYNSTLQQRTTKELIFAWQQQAYDPVAVALTRLRSDGPGNRENINDPVIDDLVDQLALTADPAKQRELVQKLRERYNDQVYWVDVAAGAISFRNMLQPYVRGIRAGEYASLSYYYQGPVLRAAWLDL